MARKVVDESPWWPVYELKDPDGALDDKFFAHDVSEDLVARYERVMSEFRQLQIDLREILRRPRP